MMKILDKFWKACNGIWIRVETLFFLYIQDTDYLVRCSFFHLCIGLFQKKSKQGGWVYTFGIFYFFTLPLEISDKTKLSPYIFHRIVLDPLEVPRPKTKQTPGISTLFFPGHPLEIPFCFYCLINPWKFHMLFFGYPWKFHILENT